MKTLLVVSSHSFRDPLFSGLIYQYVRGVKEKRPDYRFVFFTEEQANYAMSEVEMRAKRNELFRENIIWHPLRYRSGRFMIVKKLFNFLQLLWLCFIAKLKYKPQAILGFIAIAGGYSYILSRLFRMKLIIFCFEPHSRYMADFGVWPRTSLQYKLLNRFEFLQATKCDMIAVPTKHTEVMIREWGTKAKIWQVPVSIEADKFHFNEAQRNAIRAKHHFSDRYAMMYLGKFAGAYYSVEEVARFCRELFNAIPQLYFYIITPYDTAKVNTAFSKAGFTSSDFVALPEIPYSEIDQHLSAADLGMMAIPPLPAQKYRTPVKSGIYLACGLPYLINRGVSDEDDLALEENVGVVVESEDEAGTRGAIEQIKRYMNEDKVQLRERCRAAAYKHKDVRNAVRVLDEMLSELERK